MDAAEARARSKPRVADAGASDRSWRPPRPRTRVTCSARSSRGSRSAARLRLVTAHDLSRRDHSIVLRVRTDPEPDDHVALSDPHSPIVSADSGGENGLIRMDLLELQAWVP